MNCPIVLTLIRVIFILYGNDKNLKTLVNISNIDQLCFIFQFLRQQPKLYSITMEHLRCITEKNVERDHFVLSHVPDIFRILFFLFL